MLFYSLKILFGFVVICFLKYSNVWRFRFVIGVGIGVFEVGGVGWRIVGNGDGILDGGSFIGDGGDCEGDKFGCKGDISCVWVGGCSGGCVGEGSCVDVGIVFDGEEFRRYCIRNFFEIYFDFRLGWCWVFEI